jgi:multidrug efflux system membrane fusion protein
VEVKTSKRGRIKLLIFFLIFAALVGAVVWRFMSNSAKEAAAAKAQQQQLLNRPVNVQVVAAETRAMPIYLTALGTVTPYNSVTLKARVNGPIQSVRFTEGQEVRQGQALIQIDPAPYRATLNQARGTLAHDQALLKNAQVEFTRYKALYAEGVISKESLDTYESSLGQYLGAIETDKAAIESDQLQLNWCTVTAPFSGRVGLRLVDPGNIIVANTTNLIIINQFKPIAVDFTLPEAQLPQALAKLAANKKLKVEAWDRADQTKIADGFLLTADNQMDPTTGTAKLKAVFPNTDEVLFPNQFVNIHLILEVRNDALVVPSSALQTGTMGSFVWVATPDKTAQLRTVNVEITEGQQTILKDGLRVGEMVVVDGADKIRTGSRLDAKVAKNKSSNPGGKSGDRTATTPAATTAPVGKGPGKAPTSPHARRNKGGQVQ